MKHLGLIVLQSDRTIEDDFRRLIAPEASLLVSRVPSAPDVSRETLAAMEDELPQAAALFPQGHSFDAVGYGCTSGTSVIGAQRIADLVRSGCDTRHVSEPVSALVAACADLGLSRLAFLSPYVEAVSDTLRGVLATSGIETPVFGSFDEASEAAVAEISTQDIIDRAVPLARDDNVSAIFLSCKNLKTLDALSPIAAATGKPVLSSNLVLAWHLARLCGLKPATLVA